MRILVIRFSSIGDIIQCTSPLTSIKNAYPDSEIDFLTLSHFKSILDGHPSIKNILTIDQTASIKVLRDLGKSLNENKYDILIDLHGSLRSKIVSTFVRCKKKFLQKKPRWKRMLLKEFHINTFDGSYNYKQLLHQTFHELIPVTDTYPNTSLKLNDDEMDSSDVFFESFGIKSPYTVIIPGAAWSNKEWSPESYSKVINNLIKDKIQFIILGSEKNRICDNIDSTHPSVINLKGKTSLRESMRIIANANNCIGSDTGLIHAAEAFGIPVISINGPTNKEMGAGVQLPKSINVENENVWCRPCSQNGSRPCYRSKQFCMESISVNQVLNGFNLIAKS